jgi:N-terminal domain of reverse transcriptase
MHEATPANGPNRQTDWDCVNWRKANRIVRNLRQRIFRASQEGKHRKVHSLQKLMLRYASNRLLSVRRVTQQLTRRQRDLGLLEPGAVEVARPVLRGEAPP